MHKARERSIIDHMTTASAATARTVAAGPLVITLTEDPAPFAVALSAREAAPGVWEIDLGLTVGQDAVPPPLSLRWSLPCTDLHSVWRGGGMSHRGALPPDWSGGRLTSRACSNAPVVCLHSRAGGNRLTFALDEALSTTQLGAGVREESGEMLCSAHVFTAGLPAGRAFRVRLRLDLRDRPWHETVADVARWWETPFPPLPVPDVGRLPMYSTWYAFHQAVEPGAVERQCRLAKDLGCEAVIMDDGWQTLDGNRGYAFCGDWRPERIPDLAGHVRRVHALGMKFLLWYSVPFIGFQARNYPRFAGKYLVEDQRKGCATLDPRFPEVRAFLVGLYERALVEWDLDGFKLDFVDSFARPPHAPATAEGGRDLADVDVAAVRLLREVVDRLRARKPDVLIEFRQSYVGPVMRTLGNLFRAGDCPADAIGNRHRTLDIRAVCGATACHSDMLMWHPDEPVESAALQLLDVLYSVPQISVLLDRVPASHQAMLRFWLGWWRAHRGCLLDGALSLEHPEQGYTQATARTAGERITSLYSAEPVRLGADEPALIQVVNATRGAGVILDCAADLGERTVTVRDTQGAVVAQRRQRLGAGLHRIEVPPAGLAAIG